MINLHIYCEEKIYKKCVEFTNKSRYSHKVIFIKKVSILRIKISKELKIKI